MYTPTATTHSCNVRDVCHGTFKIQDPRSNTLLTCTGWPLTHGPLVARWLGELQVRHGAVGVGVRGISWVLESLSVVRL